MEDTTSNSIDDPEPTLGLGLDDLLISSKERWAQAPPPRFVDACDNLRCYGVNLATGAEASVPVQCHSWDHQSCAEEHAVKELRIFDGLIAGYGVVFYAKVLVDEFRPARLSDRRSRLAKKVGRVWYRWCRRSDGWVWVIASHPLTGRDEPRLFVATQFPLRLAAVALRQPGVRRVDGSRVSKASAELRRERQLDAGQDDDEESGVEPDGPKETVEEEADRSPSIKWIGSASHARWEETKERAAAYAERRFGVEVNPAYPVVIGSGFTAEQWAECLAYARSRM